MRPPAWHGSKAKRWRPTTRRRPLRLQIKIDAGPEVKFGPTTIAGSEHVKIKLFENKISWKTGETYDTRLIDKTQQKLLDTGFFNSIIVAHDFSAERRARTRDADRCDGNQTP
jgi:outer membrane translocation and assembly module TamA